MACNARWLGVSCSLGSLLHAARKHSQHTEVAPCIVPMCGAPPLAVPLACAAGVRPFPDSLLPLHPASHPLTTTTHRPPTDFSGFFNQLQKDKQTTSRASAGILQESPQQNSHPLDTNVQRHCEDGAYQQQQQCLQDNLGAFGAYQTGMHQQQQQQQHHHQQQQHMSTLDQLLTQHDLGSRHKLPDRDLAQVGILHHICSCAVTCAHRSPHRSTHHHSA